MFKKSILQMQAYHPPLEGRRKVSAQNGLLLDFNERVTPIPSQIQKALSDSDLRNLLNVYPEYENIQYEIATYANVQENQIMHTNGSDQAIDLVFRACCSSDDEAIIPKPSFVMFFQSAAIEGAKIISPEYLNLGQRFAYPVDDVIAAITDKTKIITVCSPNNPTGDAVKSEDIIRIAEAAPNAAILVDECYFEYSKMTVIDQIENYPNLFITRSFSKTFGIPSLRLGYLVSTAENINQLLKIRGPYDVNMAAITVLKTALKNQEYLSQYAEEINEAKQDLYTFLSQHNFEYWESDANFLLTRPPVANAQVLEEFLRKKNILTRPRTGPGIDNTLRITIPGKSDLEKLKEALTEFISAA